MIGLLLLLSAQAVATTPADAQPPTPPPARKVCRRPPGSVEIVCKSVPGQAAPLELAKPAPQTYGPALPGAQSTAGHGITLRGQASNRGRAGRNRSMATVGIPF